MTDKTLEDLAAEWREADRLVGCVLPQSQVAQAAVAAARFYAGFGYIESLLPAAPATPAPQPFPDSFVDDVWGLFGFIYDYPIFAPQPPKIIPGSPLAPVDWVLDATTVIQPSEWSVIRSLFILYVERENALYQEASRQAGLEVYGRSSSEIATDIERMETELPHRAACQPIFTI